VQMSPVRERLLCTYASGSHSRSLQSWIFEIPPKQQRADQKRARSLISLN
jgi:hypothetical protein